jgi:ubiquinone/menaquinone biosynthesis C-methylase UbiE
MVLPVLNVIAPRLTPLATAVLHVPQPERVLVIGGGDGEAALFLAREFSAARVRGADRSADRVREAQARMGLDPEGRLAFKQAGVRTLPYPDDFFDLIAYVEGHILVAEAARVLRVGGHFICAQAEVPRFAAARERLLLRRLRRRGFALCRVGRVGGGNFLVAHLSPDR